MLGNALPCPECQATGQVSRMAFPLPCPECNGAGWVLKDEAKDDSSG